MKKMMMMMAMTAIALFTITACGDDDDDKGNSGSSTSQTPTFAKAPYKDQAMVLKLDENTEGIKELRMMESGAFMITREAATSRVTRAGGIPIYEFGKFIMSGGAYKFNNGMEIRVEKSGGNYDVTITWEKGTTIKTTGYLNTSGSVASGVMTDNLCAHAWTIQKLQARGKFNGVTLGKEFSAPIKLAEVKSWFESNGGTLKDKFEATEVINGIRFDNQGLFAILYDNRNSHVGAWRWLNMNDGKLSYSWNDKMSAISFFTGDATVSFKTNPETCTLTLKGNVDGYDLDFVFTLQ